MTWLRILSLRLWAVLAKRGLDREVEEELKEHLRLLTEENLRRGMTLEEARRAANLTLGGVEQIKEAVRSQRGLLIIETIFADLRFGVRRLRTNLAFTAVAVLTLGLGIGANTAIFSILDAVLIRPLSYRDPGRLVWIAEHSPQIVPNFVLASTFLLWRERSQSLADLAAYIDHLCDGNLVTGGKPVRVDRCAEVSANFFSLLGIQPTLGRSFLEQEMYPGARGVMILSDGFWRKGFGADPQILGKTVQLDNLEYTVVGILSRSFRYPGDLEPNVFVPIMLPPKPDWRERESGKMNVIGNLKPSVTPELARAELKTLTQFSNQNYPQELSDKLAGSEVRVAPLHEHLVGNTRTSLLVLMGAAGLVLLIACANIANLLLAQAVARQKEFAMRTALGARTARIIGQLLTEGMLLSILGSAVGLLIAVGATKGVRALQPTMFVHFEDPHINGTALAFTLLISLGISVIFSLAPAVLISHKHLSNPLREAGGRTTARSRQQRLGNGLVTLELALAFVLVVGATLLLRTLGNLRAVRLGFDPRNVLTVQVTLTEANYPQPGQQKAFFDKLVAAINSLPGVESVGGTTSLPLYYGLSNIVNLTVEDGSSFFGDRPLSAPVSSVTPKYFSVMGIPLEAGRFFGSEDRQGTLPVAIVSREFTRRFGIDDAIGRHLRFTTTSNEPEQQFTIVGVVGDIRYFGPSGELAPVVFISVAQFPASALTLAVRTRTDPASLANAIRNEVENLDKGQPIYHVATMEQRLSDSITSNRFDALLFGTFAGVGILLATVGTYGVMSYWVAQRRHEIGVRIALGAQRHHVLQLIVGRALWLTIVGLAVGLLGALGLAHFLASLLFEIQPTDSLTFGGVAVILAGVALAASAIPALRATRLDPMLELRCE